MHRFFLAVILIDGIVFGLFGPRDQAHADEALGGPQIKSVQIGFDGKYRVGHWTPLRITIAGGSKSLRGRLEVTAPDSDGVRVTYGDAGHRSVEIAAGKEVAVSQYIKFGRTRTDLTVRLVDDGRELATRTFSPSAEMPSPLPSTQETIVSVGRPIESEEALRKRLRGKSQSISICQLDDPEAFPRHWFGYEGVDTIVASTSEMCALERLDELQINAIERWVQLGGRLILCVGQRGEEVFGEENPLARFSPGNRPQVIPQRQTSGLKDYAGATEGLDPGRDGIKMTAVADVRGKVVSSETAPRLGRLPTIVRFPFGFGKVVFVAFDPDRPPFADWQGRPSLVARLLEEDGWGRRDGSDARTRSGRVAHLGFEDLVGQLREALDEFQGVTRVRFSWIAGLIILYVLLIGPGDYFLLKKFGRLHWTWLTFPLIVLAFSVLAFVLADRLSGNRLRVNQVELVDVDIESSVLRGTMWAHIYSPDTQAFNLSLERRSPNGIIDPGMAGLLLTWQGLPGNGLGGMNATAAADVFTEPYQILYPSGSTASQMSAISGLPILTSASKSLTARWWAGVDADLEGRLTATSNGLLSGRLTYPLDVKLSDSMVLYENRAYLLSGTISPGESISFDHLKYRDLEWRLTRRKVIQTRDVGTPWDQTSQDVSRIMEIMMFHEAAGGESYTGLSQRYQPFVDLSDHLRTGRAILVGRSETPASQLVRDGESLADSYDRHWTYYRVVFPVEKQ